MRKDSWWGKGVEIPQVGYIGMYGNVSIVQAAETTCQSFEE